MLELTWGLAILLRDVWPFVIWWQKGGRIFGIQFAKLDVLMIYQVLMLVDIWSVLIYLVIIFFFFGNGNIEIDDYEFWI
jgi:hypothetical protein